MSKQRLKQFSNLTVFSKVFYEKQVFFMDVGKVNRLIRLYSVCIIETFQPQSEARKGTRQGIATVAYCNRALALVQQRCN